MKSPNSNPLLGAFLSLGAFGLYATTDTIIKAMGQNMTAFQVIFTAALCALPFILLRAFWGEGTVSLRPVLPGITLARVVIILVNAVFVSYSFAHLELSEAYSIFFCMPLMITVLAVPFLGEKLDTIRIIAVLVGFAGVLVALRPGSEALKFAHLTALIGASMGALNSLLLRKAGGREKASVMLLYPALAQVVALGALMPMFWVPMTTGMWGAAWAVGALSTVAGVMIIAAYAQAPAAVAAPMQYSQIIWGAFYGWLLFSETMDFYRALGITIIVGAGLWLLWWTGYQERKSAEVSS